MGIIGTVMGLIHVLGSLQDPTGLGPSIAVAFTATLYGVASANIIFCPLRPRLKHVPKKKLQIWSCRSKELWLFRTESTRCWFVKASLLRFRRHHGHSVLKGIAHETAE